MNIRGDYMKGLFIILIIFSLFISGCELVQEGTLPQFRNEYNVMSIPTEGDYLSGGGGSHGGNTIKTIQAYTCESTFVDGQCSGEVNPSLYATCSLNPALDCEGGNKCVGPFSGSVDICGGDYTAYGWGLCYCVGDGVCDTSYGETTASPDCAECTPGETQTCNLPQLPGTCGLCNAGLKTCTAGSQWGSCQQVIAPVTEICDNNLDDDCDCSPDISDSDCYNTHLECANEQCIEVGGAGFDQCSIDLDCAIPTHLECQNEQCVELTGDGVDQCSIDLDCTIPTHLECLNNECVEFSGEGSNQCSANNDCIITHMECIGTECVEINGEGVDQCSVALDCTVPTHLECQNQDCVEVTGPGASQCSVDLDCAPQCGDGVCDTGESCAGDAIGCPDPVCGLPTCYNGCGQYNIRSGLTDNGCDGDYVCDGTGGCRLRNCNIITPSWGGYAADSDRYRLEGLDISVYLQGNADCIGSTASFEVMEDDGVLGDDPVLIEPNDAVFEKVEVLGGGVYARALSTWTVEYQNDGLGGYPEYYFNYFIDSDPDENDRNQGLLTVRSDSTPLNCGNSNSGYECITDVNDNPRVPWFANGDEVCAYNGEKTCVSSGSGPDRYWSWYLFQPGGYIVYQWDDYSWCGGPGEPNPSWWFDGATDVDTRFKCV